MVGWLGCSHQFSKGDTGFAALPQHTLTGLGAGDIVDSDIGSVVGL